MPMRYNYAVREELTTGSPITGALPASPILRRLGSSPRARGSATECTCPDLFELADGNFAVIGTDRTDELRHHLPEDAGVAQYERIVVVSRETLVAARKDLPFS
ncbi:hypothetical protein [Paractinoplanes hotanensis]|uniref:Uncharacterized protein n=1 Tax=Paractinoplanes hotanensis TaxID=2906497 RepID=A0ABT0Y8S1_9ACTN|nr:hypothetical protein [Actinoplanes hotanensis]MCM4082437.1 hypothetical protein [Actinoplanes hotanensis]